MTWLQPQFLWLLTLLPAVAVLHLWRRKRRKVAVSALFLWEKALETSSMQRISMTWLLLLQLLAVTLLSVVLAQPRLVSAKTLPTRVIIIDASASMAATHGTTSRLEEAKRKALELYHDAGGLLLIRAGIIPRVISDDKQGFRAALENIKAFDAEAGLESALHLALDLQPDADIHVISDYLPEALRESTGFRYHAVGDAQTNIGITTFHVQNGKLFATFYNNGIRPYEADIQLYRNNQRIAAYTLQLQRQGETPFSADIPDAESLEGMYKLSLVGSDALALDNHAYAGTRALRAVVAPENPLLERSFLAVDGVKVQPAPSLATGLRLPADVTVHSANGDAVEQFANLPKGNHIIFAAPNAAEEQNNVLESVLTWDRQDSVLRFVDLANVQIVRNRARQQDLKAQEAALQAQGWHILARDTSLSPLILRKSDAQGRLYYFAFAPQQSNLLRQPAWVILVNNLLKDLQHVVNLPLGSPIQTLESSAAQTDMPSVANHVGIYGADDGLGNAMYVVNLYSSQESALPRTPAAPLAAHAAAQGKQAEADTSTVHTRDFSLWLVIVLILILSIEGYGYMAYRY